MNHNNKIVAVLLTVYNRKNITLLSLKNLFNQTLPEGYTIEVYLTDDGCTDGTPDAVKVQFPQVNIIKVDGNLFWNRGMIAAWKEATKIKPDFFLLLNDDTYLLDNALKNLIDLSVTMLHTSVIVGATLNAERDRITYGGRMKFKGLITECNASQICDTFNGNTVLIPTHVYDKVGMLDSVFHHGIGDSDYGLRVTEAGLKCILCGEPIGICDSHTSLPKWCNPKINVIERFKYLYRPGGNGNNPIEFFIFKNRHYGLFSAMKSFITNHIHALVPSLWPQDASKY